VYTSREWSKAVQYAIPHVLDGSCCFTKVVALFVIPGASGEGGTAIWKKRIRGKKNEWFLVPEDAADDAEWDQDTSDETVPYQLLQDRVKNRRLQGVGEVAWTTADDTPDKSHEDQSSVVHLAGFFITHCSASSQRKMTCNSRESDHFVGWDVDLEPPIGRAIESWDDVEPRPGRPTAEQSLATSIAQRSSVWDAGSSIDGSPRGELPKKQAVQIRTYQDVDSETNLGSLKKWKVNPCGWSGEKKSPRSGVCCVEKRSTTSTI
jgi:hypothetical protein